METLVEKLSVFVKEAEFDSLSESVVQETKYCILDTLGCIIGGSIDPSTKALSDFLEGLEGRKDARIFVSGIYVPCLNAALLNGTMGNVLELDDIIPEGGHSGTAIIPTCFAVGEYQKSSGRDLVTAVAVGYEVIRRIGFPIRMGGCIERGFNTSGIIMTFGAAAAASKLLNLDESQIMNALGICSLTPLSPLEPLIEGSDVKNILSGGWSAYVGILAALLAQRGFTGPKTIIEGKYGLYRLLLGEDQTFDKEFDLFLKSIGRAREWSISNIKRKMYPSCGFAHSSLDAALKISKEISLSDIEKVIVRTQTITARTISRKSVKNAASARFSLPFLLGLAFKERKITPDSVYKNIHDRQIHEFMRKVSIDADKKLDLLFPSPPLGRGYLTSILEVHTKDKKKLVERVDIPRGDPRMPLTEDDLTRKFKNLSSKIMCPEQVRKIIQNVQSIEKLHHASKFVDLLVLKRELKAKAYSHNSG